MTESLEGYELVSSTEYGDSGIKLFVRYPRPLGNKDSSTFRHALDQIQKGLEEETVNSDPETPARIAHKKGLFRIAFEDAGISPIYLEAIPNEYWPEAYVSERLLNPWYIVTTTFGHLKVGWRKRVIVLDWERTTLRVPSSFRPETLRLPTGQELFPDEDVTRWESGIHCYGYEKFTEYLKVLKAQV